MNIKPFGKPAFGVFASTFSLGGVDHLPVHVPISDSGAEVSSVLSYTQFAPKSSASVEVSGTSDTQRIPKIRGWDEEAKRQFSELSKRAALQTITPEESLALERLNNLRRHEMPSRSFAEIRADIEFHRAVEDAIKAIQRLMDHDTESYFTKA